MSLATQIRNEISSLHQHYPPAFVAPREGHSAPHLAAPRKDLANVHFSVRLLSLQQFGFLTSDGATVSITSK
jgi:hypothetical protein